MLDLVGTQIVGFLTRRLIFYYPRERLLAVKLEADWVYIQIVDVGRVGVRELPLLWYKFLYLQGWGVGGRHGEWFYWHIGRGQCV